jgi:hypothetical protein
MTDKDIMLGFFAGALFTVCVLLLILIASGGLPKQCNHPPYNTCDDICGGQEYCKIPDGAVIDDRVIPLYTGIEILTKNATLTNSRISGNDIIPKNATITSITDCFSWEDVPGHYKWMCRDGTKGEWFR